MLEAPLWIIAFVETGSSDLVFSVELSYTKISLQFIRIKIQSVPRSKHSVSVIKTSQLMLYRK